MQTKCFILYVRRKIMKVITIFIFIYAAIKGLPLINLMRNSFLTVQSFTCLLLTHNGFRSSALGRCLLVEDLNTFIVMPSSHALLSEVAAERILSWQEWLNIKD
jgi:hypothetical protein